MYVQVADDLRRRIQSGEYPPRRRLPSVDRLAEEYGVARNTMTKAIERLRATGHVYTVRNWGSVVRAGDKDIAVVVMEPGSRATIRAATGQERARLDLAEGAYVLVVERGDEIEVLPADRVEIRGPEGEP